MNDVNKSWPAHDDYRQRSGGPLKNKTKQGEEGLSGGIGSDLKTLNTEHPFSVYTFVRHSCMSRRHA